MATRSIVAGGGRTSGGTSVTPDTLERQQAQNPALEELLGTSLPQSPAPVLNAAEMDRLFGLAATQINKPSGSYSDSESMTQPGTATSVDSFGAMTQSGRDSAAIYGNLGWNLGWNTMGTGVRRGAAAFGLKENPTFRTEGENGGGGSSMLQSANKYQNLQEIAGIAKVNPDVYKDAMGNLNETALKAAVDEALKDYYMVSGDTGGMNNWENATPFKFLSSMYKREGDSLKPISGTEQYFTAPENSAGHFQEYLAPIVSILAGPILSGLGVLGQAGSLTTGISGATGLSPFVSNLVGSALVRGGLSAAGGGKFGQGALAGAAGAGLTPLISETANNIAGQGTTGAGLLNVGGRLGLQAVLNGGQLSPMAAVSTFLDTVGKGNSKVRK